MMAGVEFAPLVPVALILSAAGLAVLLLAVAAAGGAKGVLLRTSVFAVLLLALANPRTVHEVREPRSDIAVALIDTSESQTIGTRTASAEVALASLGKAVEKYKNMELRVVRAKPGAGDEGTRLFRYLGRALTEIPENRFAGAVMITDGQVHDVPGLSDGAFAGPVHVMLTGKRDETDRRLVIDRAPGYGIVGAEVSIEYHIEERGGAKGAASKPARVQVRKDGVEVMTRTIAANRRDRVTFTLDHAGPNVFEIESEPLTGELSDRNNRTVVTVNGVRDRLRVLLVSGQPHAGERTWRNLLKSDPSVDLVHFTILRPPDKDDFTPLRELALIIFPVQELFEVKLKEFDLVVFDRYVIRDVLSKNYFENIDAYVRAGGALMVASGPEFAGPRSLFRTPLEKVIPAVPTGMVIEEPFKPALTDIGRRHPVTSRLRKGMVPGKDTDWGRWFRQIEVRAERGLTLMSGVGERPLLTLDRVGKGRVAQLSSDHIWLWARQFDGGGPQAELLRRLSHWMMKEPDLEEENLRGHVAKGELTVERQSLGAAPATVTVTTPSGKTLTKPMPASTGGVSRQTFPISETGLYRIEDGTHVALTAAGAVNPLEFADLRTTDSLLAPLARATGGGVLWLADGVPEIRRVRRGRDSAGRGWIGLRENGAYAVTGLDETPLLPGLLVLLVALAGLMTAWWREGR